jgi:hypothetical protein
MAAMAAMLQAGGAVVMVVMVVPVPAVQPRWVL